MAGASAPLAAGAGAPSSLQLALDLKQVAGCDIFIGSEDAVGRTPWGNVFGGQVLAQSFVAAQRTVPPGFTVHSLHGFFLLTGQSGVEIVFEVDRVRDGRSFITRTVKALQKNKAIFQLSVSFHRPEWGPRFQTPARDILRVARTRGLESLPMPEDLLARGVEIERFTMADNNGDTESLPIRIGAWWGLHWVRHAKKLPDLSSGVHQAIFAWMTDSRMVRTIVSPHVHDGVSPFKMATSLDHSIHFHGEPFRVDEWLLFSNRTTVSAGARGLARCEVWTKDGHLVATVTQEALTRVSKEDAAREAAAEASSGMQHPVSRSRL